MKRTKNFALNLWIVFVFVCFTAIQSEAQIIKMSILTDPTPDNGVPLAGTFGLGVTTINFQFSLDGGTVAGPWSIIGCGASCAAVVDNASTGAGHINVPATATEINFDVSVNGGSQERHVTIKFRRPIDLVLVLDKSGSMSSPSGPTTRWEALKTAVNAFIEKFELDKVDGDRVSISYFHSVVENGVGTPGSPFIDITTTAPTSKTQISTSLAANGPASMTAMGEGLVDAKNKLTSSTTKTKIVLLFTDGIQNWPNTSRLVAVAGDKLNDATPINTGPGSDPGSIKIYSIGIGYAGSVPAILTAIANTNRGLAWPTETGNEQTLMNNFSNAFSQMLNLFSPQLLGSFHGSATGISSLDSATFTCNQTVQKLVFEVYSPVRLQLSFEKDGKLVSPSLIRSDTGYQLYIFNFPHAEATIRPGGKWKAKIQMPGTGIGAAAAHTRRAFSYSLRVIADDHVTGYTCSKGAQAFKPGDVFNPSVRFTQGNKAITNGHIQTIAVEPGGSLGHILATANVAINSATGTDTSSAGIRKYEQLLNDPAFLAKMLGKDRLIELSHTGDGNYSGAGIKLDTSGVYSVIFLITDTLSNGDIIKRQEEQTLYVSFDEIDLSSSQPVLQGSGSKWTLTIRPMTKQKLFVGPAFHQSFNLAGSGIVLKDVIDVGDGSYQLMLEGDPNATVDLTLLGSPVYKGKLSVIGKGDSLLDKIRAWLEKNGIPEWLFWLFLILLLLFIIWILRRKKL